MFLTRVERVKIDKLMKILRNEKNKKYGCEYSIHLLIELCNFLIISDLLDIKDDFFNLSFKKLSIRNICRGIVVFVFDCNQGRKRHCLILKLLHRDPISLVVQHRANFHYHR